MSEPATPPVEHPAKKLQRFIQAGGDLSTVPDDAWGSAGGSAFKDRVQRFVQAGGDVREVHIPIPTTPDLMPSDVDAGRAPMPSSPNVQRFGQEYVPDSTPNQRFNRRIESDMELERQRAENEQMSAQGFRAVGGGTERRFVPMNGVEMGLSAMGSAVRQPVREGFDKAVSAYDKGNVTGATRGLIQSGIGLLTAPLAPATALNNAIAAADKDPSLPKIGGVGRTLGFLARAPGLPFEPIAAAKEKLAEAQAAGEATGYPGLAKALEVAGLGVDVGEIALGAKMAKGEAAIRSRMSTPVEIARNLRSIPGEFMEGRVDRALAGERPVLPDAPPPVVQRMRTPPTPQPGVLVEPRTAPPPQRAFPQRPAPAPVPPSRMPMVGPEMRGVEPAPTTNPNLPVPRSTPNLTTGEAGRLPAVGGVRVRTPERAARTAGDPAAPTGLSASGDPRGVAGSADFSGVPVKNETAPTAPMADMGSRDLGIPRKAPLRGDAAEVRSINDQASVRLTNEVRKAGFRSVHEAWKAVTAGDETAAQMLSDRALRDLNALSPDVLTPLEDVPLRQPDVRVTQPDQPAPFPERPAAPQKPSARPPIDDERLPQDRPPTPEDQAARRRAKEQFSALEQRTNPDRPQPRVVQGPQPRRLPMSEGPQPELVPPASEGTVPTQGERAMAAQGGPESVAQRTGRVVVNQADGTKLLVSPDEAPRAQALADQGKLAEFVNGEGTATNADGSIGKPPSAREAVIARDASGAEVRTILTDTPDKTAAAVARQKELGLTTEVIPADDANLMPVIEQRSQPRSPAPEPPPSGGTGTATGGMAPQAAEAVASAAKEKRPRASGDAGSEGTWPVAEMDVDPKRFQFKESNAATGETGRLSDIRGPEDWRVSSEGILTVWRDPKTGKVYVTDGHQRFNAARRAGVEKLTVRFSTAKTAREAMVESAKDNIRGGSAESADVGRFFRMVGKSGPELDAYVKSEAIPLTTASSKIGKALANLSDSLWNDYLTGNLREDKAVAIGKLNVAPEIQEVLAKADIEVGMVARYARRVQEAPTVQTETLGLFGPEKTSKNLYDLEVKLEDKTVSALRAEKRALTSAAKNKSTIEKAGTLDAAKAQEIAKSSESVADVADRMFEFRGPLRDAVSRIAREVDAKRLSVEEGVRELKVEAERIVREQNPELFKADAPAESGPALFSLIDEPKKPKGRREGGFVDLGGKRPMGLRRASRPSEGGFVDMDALRETAKRVWDNVSDAPKYLAGQFGEGGRKMGEALRQIDSRERSVFGEHFTPVAEEFSKLGMSQKNEARRNIGFWTEGSKPTPPEFQALVDTVRQKYGTDLLDAQEAANIRIEEGSTIRTAYRAPGGRIFPRFPDPDIVETLRSEALPGHKGPTPHLDEFYRLNPNAPKDVWAPEPLANVGSVTPFNAANERARLYRYPDKWLPEDQWATLENHFRNTAHNIAQHEVLALRPDPTKKKTAGLMDTWKDDINNEFPDGQSRARAAEEFFNEALGHRSASSAIGQVGNKLAQMDALYQAGTKIGLNPFNWAQQLSQMANNYVLFGSRDTAVGAARTISDWGGATGRARRKGTAPAEAHSQALDLADSPTLHAGRKVVSFLNKPGEVLDRMGRLTTSEIAPDIYARAARDLAGGGRAAAKAERMFRTMEMSSDDIAAIRSGKASPTIQRRFEQNLVGFTNIEAGALNRPAGLINAIKNPGLRSIAWRFKQYPYRQIKVLKYAASEATHGNFVPLVRMAAVGVVFGEGLNALSTLIYGENKDRADIADIVRKKDMEGLLRRIAQDYAATGMAGLAGPAVTVASGAGTDAPMHIRSKLQRMVLPPTWSSIERAADALEQASSRKLAKDAFRKDGTEERESVLLARPSSRAEAAGDAFWQYLQREIAALKVAAGQKKKGSMSDLIRDSVRETRKTPAATPR